ncbi:hypothetical protein ACQPX6_04620 [Actinomycetospora sp. CA-101289]|uniref:hypothetical protein n=1 Tax=Actinomycetospora sp. CA-101289 TaxID=3239893 RepID=UPI003D966463
MSQSPEPDRSASEPAETASTETAGPEPAGTTETTEEPRRPADDDGHGAVTEQFPVPPPARRSPAPRGPMGGPQGPPPGQPPERSPDQERAAAVLDQPVDDRDLATRLRRPGLARSTRVLLLVLGAVVCLALGAFVGRATAPDIGPGSVPDLLGVVESVQPSSGGFPIVTIRSGDGTLTPLRTSAGTSVAVPRPDGPAGLRAGQQVTVHAERGADGAITAVRVDVPAGG